MEQEALTLMEIINYFIMVGSLIFIFYQISTIVNNQDYVNRIKRGKIIIVLCFITSLTSFFTYDFISTSIWIINGVMWYFITQNDIN